ncbi:MAG: DUF6326 family protein [Actinomycetota bacterium]
MTKLTTDSKLSLLWLLTALNMILADVLSLYIAILDPSVLEIPGDAKLFMIVAAVLVNVPIFMIFLSKLLPRKSNRIVNIIASIVTILFVVGGGSSLPHYIVIGLIEVVLLVAVIAIAWRWKSDV